MRRFALIAAFLCIAAVSTVHAQPTLSFEGAQVTVKGITAAGHVACYGVAHDFQAVHPELLRWARDLVDDDGDGAVTLTLTRDVPETSQWFAVDLATGGLVTGSPRPDPGREVAFSGAGILDKGASPRAVLRANDATADFFVVRQGTGSWVLLAGDGAAGDDDGVSDGAVSADFQQFKPVGKSPAAPAAFALADLIVVIDPMSLQYSILGRKAR